MLTKARQKALRRIQDERSSRVIVLLHRQEIFSLFGLPFFRFISIEDSEKILREIDRTDPEKPIDMILHTPGGLVLASTQIARALRRHPGKVRVHIPHFAMSGGTLIALGADEIFMHKDAVMGPVDPQVHKYPAVSILKVMEKKPIAEIDDETVMKADIAKKSIVQVEDCIFGLLEKSLGQEQARKIAKTLSEGKWTHDYPITFDEAKEIGLPVRDDLPEEIFDVMELYPQPQRKLPSVEFVPQERRKKESA